MAYFQKEQNWPFFMGSICTTCPYFSDLEPKIVFQIVLLLQNIYNNTICPYK